MKTKATKRLLQRVVPRAGRTLRKPVRSKQLAIPRKSCPATGKPCDIYYCTLICCARHYQKLKGSVARNSAITQPGALK